ITHDCFLNLVRRPHNYDPARGSLKTYFYGVTRNLVLKYFRAAGREAEIEDADEPLTPTKQQPLQKLLDADVQSAVRSAIADLPTVEREALVMFEYEGLTLNEIAEIVGADVGAVKARIFRGRQRLKSMLWPYLNSGGEIVTLEKALK